MAQNEGERQSASLVGNDIVFDCVHCGKSLAIGVQGAGLNIQCPECGKDIYVPIPQGIELSDIDKSLGASAVEPGAGGLDENTEAPGDEDDESRVNRLITELEELRFRTQFLEGKQAQYKQATQELIGRLDVMRTALKEMDAILAELIEKSADDTQQLG